VHAVPLCEDALGSLLVLLWEGKLHLSFFYLLLDILNTFQLEIEFPFLVRLLGQLF